MPEYNYIGTNKAGKRVVGKLAVNSEGDLRMVLRSQGVRPLRITVATALNRDLGALLKLGVANVPADILIAVTRQLQVLVSSGIPLLQGIEVLGEQCPNSTMRNVLGVVKERVAQGGFLWEALAAYPTVFPKIFVALIRAGEASGTLDAMLKRISRYLEDSDRLKKMIKGAMMYPVIVVSIGIAVVALMMIFVIPKFEEILRQQKQALPGPTQFVVDLSHFMVGNLPAIIGTLVTSVFLLKRFIATKEGRALKDRIVFVSPIFGQLSQKSGVAKFARTLQTLLSSGVNLMDAIDICKQTVDNAVLEDAISKIRSDVETGKTLGNVVGKLPVFPKMAVQMIAVGESTGNLDKMLEKVADFYESDVETLVGSMSKLIEPIVIVVLGAMVGGIMIAMYLPIFKLAGSME